MEKLAFEAELAWMPVERIAGDRQADGSEVDADLMGAARVELHVQERPARMSRCRMHDEAGALVDDEQVLVLVRNTQVKVLRDEVARRRRRRLELDLLAAGELRALCPRAAVDEYAAVAQ